MARMYLTFKTNMRDSSDDYPTPEVDNLIFKTPDERYLITVGCNGEADWGVYNGVYNARFKGLEYQVEDQILGKTILEYGEEPTDEILSLLKNSRLSSMFVDVPEECGYEDDYVFEYKCVKANIIHNTEAKEYDLNFYSLRLYEIGE